ncbi:MAG: UDP-N-acetylmuramoyl-L-alanine--D-glutamate ligase [Kyrpidia sp.]|nr:UDP-N-acetylmuramoyl-L-alanine--D-glutamate ligase [Kyrpidia sp.]
MNEWAGARVLVVGLARSGAAAARLLARHGAEVTVTDRRSERELGEELAGLEGYGIRLVVGGHPGRLFAERVDWVVKNPGVPYSAYPVAEAIRRGIPVVTELELAWRIRPERWIGITGTNGKTTTTTWVGHMLASAGMPHRVAGNIGVPLCDVVEEIGDDLWLVAELSSFQLQGILRFRPRIGAILNIYPAHLDYHGSLEAYAAAKKKLFANQETEDWAVTGGGREDVQRLTEGVRARFARFGGRPVKGIPGMVVEGGRVMWWDGRDGEPVCAVEEVALPGAHNLDNFLAAGTVARLAGAPLSAVAASGRGFRGVEHRMEFIRRWRGVAFYNDSKATNPDAAARALGAFSRNVIWIAGGLDRGDDYRCLLPLLGAGRVKMVMVMGQSGPRIEALAKEAGISTRRVSDVEEAVRQAASLAREGDVVLLSPAAASWDQYRSFEERGRMFKEAVNKL